MHDGRQRMRRLPEERGQLRFQRERHVVRTVGIMVWAVRNGCRSRLLFIREPITAQRYVQEVLEPILSYIRQGAELQIPFSNKMMPHRKGFFKVS
jgi:hypothetical protein